MDDEYQQKRRQAMSQRPTNLGQGLAKGGKGLVKVCTHEILKSLLQCTKDLGAFVVQSKQSNNFSLFNIS